MAKITAQLPGGGTNPVINFTSQLINDGDDNTSVYVEQDELGAVAFTNDFNDLDNSPLVFPPGAHIHLISDVTNLQVSLDTKVDENSPIISATGTKVSVDSKGLVTTIQNATTADINDSLNRRYVSDADLVDINNLSGTNSGDNAPNANSNTYADNNFVDLVNPQDIAGIKNFTNEIHLSGPEVFELKSGDAEISISRATADFFKINQDNSEITWANANNYSASLNSSLNTANRAYQFPNISGTVALIANTITNGIITSSPSQDVVFDALLLKADDNNVVKLISNQIINGEKTFNEDLFLKGILNIYDYSTSGFGNVSLDANKYIFNYPSLGIVTLENTTAFTSQLIFSGNTTSRAYTLPDSSGKIVLENSAIRTVSATTLLTKLDRTLNISAGTFIVDIVTAVTSLGYTFEIINSGTGIVTLDPFSTETVGGELTLIVPVNSGLIIKSDGSNWIVVDKFRLETLNTTQWIQPIGTVTVGTGSSLNLLTNMFDASKSVNGTDGGFYELDIATDKILTNWGGIKQTHHMRIGFTITTGTDQHYNLTLRRYSDNSILSSAKINRDADTGVCTADFITYTYSASDPFVVGGLYISLDNNSGSSVDLVTSINLLIVTYFK